jgi:hypothetical protein
LKEWLAVNKYEVTFKFKSVDAVVEVLAADETSAIAAARCKEAGPPVPDSIPAFAVEIMHGGARKGSGNRARRSLVDEARSIKKQLRWTQREWVQIEAAARAAKKTVAEYQRCKILGAD